MVTVDLPAWSTDRLKRLSQMPKRYVADPGLLAGMLRVGVDDVLASGDLIGRFIDTFVVSQLRAQAAASATRYRLSHLRNSDGRREVDVIAGDSAVTPYGGGAWASRGMAIGGEAALQAGKALRENILELASSILQTTPDALTLGGGEIRDASSGEARMSLAELGKIGYFRQDTLAPGVQPELMVTRHFVPSTNYSVANGVQGAHVEVDIETGFIRLLGWWVADDCGRVINPMLVDEQLRGGVIQGIGNALYEHLEYDEAGQILNGTFADYLLPMSDEMPDISIAHVVTPVEETELGANGIGESGTIGAIAALWCAVNDALRPLGAQVTRQPFTPEHILEVVHQSKLT